MKARSLTYNIERNNFFKVMESDDFTAFLETGRMLNALGVAAESCREVFDRRDSGYRSCEAASFLSRLSTRMLKLVEKLSDRYYDEPFFDHFKEMFSGEIRSFPGLTMNQIRPAEFRLISSDQAVKEIIRQLDVFGIDILFPRDPAEQVEAFHEEAVTQFEFGRYSAIRPKDRLELQHLVRHFTVIHDFAIGAEILLKALAKKLAFKTARVDKDNPDAETIKAAGPKWYDKN
jgi:hypothetical protein